MQATYKSTDCLRNAQAWELPFRHQVTLATGERGRSLVICSWQPYRISIQSIVGEGYQLLSAGWANITKRGALGRMSASLMNGGSASQAMFAAYRAWVEAGKPAEFVWTD
jgi:hypothetical protein